MPVDGHLVRTDAAVFLRHFDEVEAGRQQVTVINVSRFVFLLEARPCLKS